MTHARREAFDALFENHYLGVLRYLTRRVASRADAEDLAAEVFRIAWQKQNPAEPLTRAWLFKVASNALNDLYRRQGRRADVEAALRRRLEDGSDNLAVDDRLALRDAVRRLSTREQEALRLTYWEGLSAAEVGQVLGCRTATVWTLISRARSKLLAAMSELAPSGGSK